MSTIIRPHVYTKGGILQLVTSIFWICICCIAFSHFRLPLQSQDFIGLILFAVPFCFHVGQLLNLFFVRAIILDTATITVRSLYRSTTIPIEKITDMWYMVKPSRSILQLDDTDLLMRSNTRLDSMMRSDLYLNVVLGADGMKRR